ncbi:MAG: immunoglobulin domain-containing protein [Phycisphaerales bacterium]|nr:immunoglobulin domain-containing protein [Phycisphaerales bacterium]
MRPSSHRSFLFACAAGLAASAFSLANAAITTIGGLSNFDCPNNTGEICDEFEIELEGPQVEDVYYTWGNYNYGKPAISRNATLTGTLLTYKLAGHQTNPGAIEHFGVTLRAINLLTATTCRWKHNGAVVSSGQFASPPIIIPQTQEVENPENPEQEIEVETIEPPENPENPEQGVWIRRYYVSVPREVNLGELMPDDPLIVNSTPIEPETELMEPGQTRTHTEVLHPEDDLQSMVLVVETYQDIVTTIPGRKKKQHTQGVLLSRAINAVDVAHNACADVPVVTANPENSSAPAGGTVTFTAAATSTSGTLHYKWRKEGSDIPLEDKAFLRLEHVSAADEGAYFCIITNDCGTSTTTAARLFIAGTCPGDINDDHGVDDADFVRFAMAYNELDCSNLPMPLGCPADLNFDGNVDDADFSIFAVAYDNLTCDD